MIQKKQKQLFFSSDLQKLSIKRKKELRIFHQVGFCSSEPFIKKNELFEYETFILQQIKAEFRGSFNQQIRVEFRGSFNLSFRSNFVAVN